MAALVSTLPRPAVGARPPASAQVVDAAVAVRALVRAAVFNVAYCRGLLPPDHFACEDAQGGQGKRPASAPPKSIVPRLIPKSPMGQRLLDWVEEGIWDALQRKYLRRIAFQILQPASGELLEEYVFSVAMHSATLELDQGGGGGGTQQPMAPAAVAGETAVAVAAPTKEAVKKQASHLIRVLCQLVATLEPLPTTDEGGAPAVIDFNIQLGYSDDTPDDYEPPFFRHAHVRDLPLFPVEPLGCNVGKMHTGDTRVSCKLRSVLADVVMEQQRQRQQQDMPPRPVPPLVPSEPQKRVSKTAFAAMHGQSTASALTETTEDNKRTCGHSSKERRAEDDSQRTSARQPMLATTPPATRRGVSGLDISVPTWKGAALAEESQGSGGAYTRRKRRKVAASPSSFDAGSIANLALA